jgi:riboflavin kinase/FMN adenylyltransferase
VQAGASFEILYGMANIGHNPTFNKQDDIRLEVNIFNFDEDIYDKYLEVFFVTRVRPEKKFNSKDELIEELKHNKEYGLSYFKLNN